MSTTHAGAAKGRGAGMNPANRFEKLSLDLLAEPPPEALGEMEAPADAGAPGEPSGPARLPTTVYKDHSRTILNPVNSPDLNFNWTINPYRGCEHGCIYCYARPNHEYLGLSCGIDFETKLFAKTNAAAQLRAGLMKPAWKGEPIVCSGVTDPYQPIEAKLRITRACVEVCAEFRQPIGFITKNRLITRDIDLFARLNEHGAVHACVSITSLDPKLAAKLEPRASSPAHRLEAVAALAAAGIPVTVMMAPIIPAITDREIPALLEAARDAGARSAGYTLVRLPHQVKDLFVEWLQRHYPDRAAHVESLIRQSRGGKLYEAKWGVRHRGEGAYAKQIGDTFHMFAKRLGLNDRKGWAKESPFRRPKVVALPKGGQLGLFS